MTLSGWFLILVKRGREEFVIPAVLWHEAYIECLSECSPLLWHRVLSDFSISCRGALQIPLHPQDPVHTSATHRQIHLLLDFPVDSGWEGSPEEKKSNPTLIP